MGTPSERLASQIVERLFAEGLVRPEDAARLVSKVAEVKARAEDWRLAVEQAQTGAREDA
jgi:hypothetical protein